MPIPSRHREFQHPIASEITPRSVYEERRQLLRLWAAGAAGATLAAWAGREALAQTPRPGKLAALPGSASAVAGAVSLEKLTSPMRSFASRGPSIRASGSASGSSRKTRSSMRTSCAWICSRPRSSMKSHAAASATVPDASGVPASNFCVPSANVASRRRTSRIMSPPGSIGFIALRRCARAQSPPPEKSAPILCALNA